MNCTSSSRNHLLRWTSISSNVRVSAVPRSLCRGFASQTELPITSEPVSSSPTTTTSSSSSSSSSPSALSVSPKTSTPTEVDQWKQEGRLRPQRKNDVQVDPNHPLYAFFRRDMSESALKEEKAKYLPFEPYWATQFESGMSS